MQIALKMFVALIAFSVGSAVVSVADYAIESIVFDTIAAIEEEGYDTDHHVALNVMATRVDFNIDGLRLGASVRDVVKAFGKPRRVERLYNDPYLSLYHYNGLLIRIGAYDQRRVVDSIEIASEEQNFAGLTIGSSLEDVRRQLGPEHYSHEGTAGYYAYTMNGYVEFNHDDTKVTRITNAYHGC